MAYNPYYPQYANQQAQQYPTAQPQMQISNCIVVPTEDDVLRYPVAPNSAVYFVLQDLSACYIKAMGTSMLDKPQIAKYNRETSQEPPQTTTEGVETAQRADMSAYALKSDIEALRTELAALTERVENARARGTKKQQESEGE